MIDTAGIVVSAATGLTTTEAGQAATFTVVLATEPTAAVTIAVSSNDTSEGTVSAASLTFDASNWDTPHTVTVTGVDDFVDDGDIAYSAVLGVASSNDSKYRGMDPADVPLVNTDDDTAGFVVDLLDGSIEVAEGGATRHVFDRAQFPTAGDGEFGVRYHRWTSAGSRCGGTNQQFAGVLHS